MKSKLVWVALLATVAFGSPLAKANEADGQMIGWIVVLDRNEINAGKEALHKTKNPAVKKYARELVNDHSKSLRQTTILSNRIHEKPLTSPDSIALKEKGEALMKKLKPLKGKEFDKTFVDAMVDGHAAAITTLNEKTSSITSPQVQNLVKVKKISLQKHLDHGKALQPSM